MVVKMSSRSQRETAYKSLSDSHLLRTVGRIPRSRVAPKNLLHKCDANHGAFPNAGCDDANGFLKPSA